jgi:hypothetical protein
MRYNLDLNLQAFFRDKVNQGGDFLEVFLFIVFFNKGNAALKQSNNLL